MRAFEVGDRVWPIGKSWADLRWARSNAPAEVIEVQTQQRIKVRWKCGIESWCEYGRHDIRGSWTNEKPVDWDSE